MNTFAWWKNHATKYLGAAISVIGAALYLKLIPAQYVELATGVIALLGGGTVKRGFTNTKAAAGK